MKRTSRRRWRASEEMQTRARDLRRAMTPAERKLWAYLRNGKLNGVWFRRQHAVGPYVVDFICIKSKLVIEIDGDYHADSVQAEYDCEGTQWLNEQKDYRVIRFWNGEVMKNIESVIACIVSALTL